MKLVAGIIAVFVAAIVLRWGGATMQESARRWAQEAARQKEIVRAVQPVLDANPARAGIAGITILGKALVWDAATDARSRIHNRLPVDLRARASDHPITVFLVRGTRQEQVGTYSVSGQPAYRQYRDLDVAYWPECKAIGRASVVSEEPRSMRPVRSSPEYADPDEAVARWIAALPRGK